MALTVPLDTPPLSLVTAQAALCIGQVELFLAPLPRSVKTPLGYIRLVDWTGRGPGGLGTTIYSIPPWVLVFGHVGIEKNLVFFEGPGQSGTQIAAARSRPPGTRLT